jgi:nucleotide-binding universal stress UspA family protein
MLVIKNILFPTDFSESANYALVHALSLAARYRADLHLFHVVNVYDDPHQQGHHFPTQDEIEKLVQERSTADFVTRDVVNAWKNIHVTRQQERGLTIAPAVLEYTDEHDIDLIVMGTHGRRGLGHLLLGSVAEEIVRLSPCPVLTVRGKKNGSQIAAIKRILVPVDFSGHAQRALAHAAELARMYGAELQLLHVIEEIMHPAFYVSGRTSIFEFMPEIEAESTKRIQGMIDAIVGKDIHASMYLREGHPTQEIVNFVEHEHSDLVVIATHGLTGIEHFLLGSITEKVVRLSPAPVLTVKGFGKSLVEGTLVEAEGEHV